MNSFSSILVSHTQAGLQTSTRNYPNPASNKVDIILNKTQTGICRIEILNPLGAIVIKEKMNCSDKNHSVNIRNLAEGVYIVKVKLNDSSIKIAKLVISR